VVLASQNTPTQNAFFPFNISQYAFNSYWDFHGLSYVRIVSLSLSTDIEILKNPTKGSHRSTDWRSTQTNQLRNLVLSQV